MKTATYLGMVVLACGLFESGCTSGGGGSKRAKAANALTRSMQFDNDGAKIIEGAPPEATPNATVTLVQTSSPARTSDTEFQTKNAVNTIVQRLGWTNNDVTTSAGSPPAPIGGSATIRPTDPIAVDMQPGGNGGIGIQVDNLNPVENPVTHILLWVEGNDGDSTLSSDSYLRIAVTEAEQSGEGDIFQAQFGVPESICSELCNKDFVVACHKAAETLDGKVTEANIANITLRCAELGDSGSCSAPAPQPTGSASNDLGPGSNGVVTMTVNNPDEENDPTVATLIWMEGADSYIELPVETASGVTGSLPKTISNGFTVTQEICDDLCNIAHDVKCYESAVTASGVVTQSNLVDIQVLCEEAGNEAQCPSARPPAGAGTASVQSVCGAVCSVYTRCGYNLPINGTCMSACQAERKLVGQSCLDWALAVYNCAEANNYCPNSGNSPPACFNSNIPSSCRVDRSTIP